MLKLLFVCSGNTCRSPSAAAVLGHRLAAAGLAGQVQVASAGLAIRSPGAPASDLAIACARARGIDLSGHRARPFAREDCAAFERIIAMDRSHLAALREICGETAAGRHQLLLDFAPAPDSGQEIPDPYGGDRADYEQAFALIESAMEGLIAALRRDAR